MPYNQAEQDLWDSLIKEYGETKGKEIYHKLIAKGHMGDAAKQRQIDARKK